MYGINGFHGDVSAPSASVFNAVDESFNYLPSPPYPANHVQAAYVEPYVYVNGGLRTFKGVATYARLKFPITPDSQWETLADMPTSRGAHGCGAIGTKIYCAYGRVLIRPWESTSVLESFDTETLQWSTDYPPGPGHPRDHVTVAVYEDKLYVFGGQYRKERGALQTVSDTVVFDPATKQWSVLADMPGFQASGAAALWRDTSSIFVVGSDLVNPRGGSGNAVNTIWQYFPETNSWQCHHPMPLRLQGMGAMVYGSHLYVCWGGAYGHRTNGYAAKYDLNTPPMESCPEYTYDVLVPRTTPYTSWGKMYPAPEEEPDLFYPFMYDPPPGYRFEEQVDKVTNGARYGRG